jgi:hypothetical protein
VGAAHAGAQQAGAQQGSGSQHLRRWHFAQHFLNQPPRPQWRWPQPLSHAGAGAQQQSGAGAQHAGGQQTGASQAGAQHDGAAQVVAQQGSGSQHLLRRQQSNSPALATLTLAKSTRAAVMVENFMGESPRLVPGLERWPPVVTRRGSPMGAGEVPLTNTCGSTCHKVSAVPPAKLRRIWPESVLEGVFL